MGKKKRKVYLVLSNMRQYTAIYSNLRNTAEYDLVLFRQSYYGPSVISVTVTKGGPLKSSRLYKTNKTIRRGIAELHN